MPNPASLTIDPALSPDQFAPGTIIHGGCRISGPQTSIGPGCILGAAAPLTLDNCQLGAQVDLAGGYFCETTCLNQAHMGSAAHIRPGTLIEEQAGGAHTVGLKQTVLFPYVILGSLINFCDALASGGCSRQNHSEIGSAYVHFNYTPHRDKATASLIGDVPRGVMLDQAPIFLGGQGGLVGPARVNFGVVVPAGLIVRNDVPGAGLFIPPPPAPRPAAHFQPGCYHSIDRIITNNLIYIGNVQALRAWYQYARSIFMATDSFQKACLSGAQARLKSIRQERLQRLTQLAEKMPDSLKAARAAAGALNGSALTQQQALIKQWPMIQERLEALETAEGNIQKRDEFLEALATLSAGRDYLKAIQSLSPGARLAGTAWLQSIVDASAALWNKPT